MTEMHMLIVGVPLLALLCAFAAVGLASITHGVSGVAKVHRHLFGPIENALGIPEQEGK